jgi:hypothetical protein
MGPQYQDYLDIALKDFYTVLTICMTVNPTLDPVAIACAVPFRIPDSLPKGWASTPRTDRQGFLHPQEMLATYRTVLAVASMIKRRRWRNPTAATLTLTEQLPGISRQRAAKYSSMKASNIALDYTAWKYGLRVTGEAVKRYLRPARNPRKLVDAALIDIEHRWGGFSEELRCLISGQPFDDTGSAIPKHGSP